MGLVNTNAPGLWYRKRETGLDYMAMEPTPSVSADIKRALLGAAPMTADLDIHRGLVYLAGSETTRHHDGRTATDHFALKYGGYFFRDGDSCATCDSPATLEPSP
jgi:hypothetical protein